MILCFCCPKSYGERREKQVLIVHNDEMNLEVVKSYEVNKGFLYLHKLKKLSQKTKIKDLRLLQKDVLFIVLIPNRHNSSYSKSSL